MNWALDGAGRWHLGCNARHGDFCFRAFRLEGETLIEVPLTETGSGRGWLDVASDGRMYYAAWEGSSIRPSSGPGLVPGAAPVVAGEQRPPAEGGGGRIAAPGGMLLSAAYNGQLMSGGQWIDMRVSFGVPVGCAAAISAWWSRRTGGPRARLGTSACRRS
jgi:hypothetical protein